MRFTVRDAQLAELEIGQDWFANPPLRYRPAATVTVGDTPANEVDATLGRVLGEGWGSLLLFPASDPTREVTESADPVMARVRRSVDMTEVTAWLAELGDETPWAPPGTVPAPYLSREYFQRYKAHLELAAAHGMTVVMYDEQGYPSGSAGGGRIDPANYRKLIERTVITSADTVEMPAGELLAAVELRRSSRARRDLTSEVAQGQLTWTPSDPACELHLFTLVTSRAQGGPQDYHAVVDYLDDSAVQQFIDVTYEAYAREIGHHLGSTVTTTFFDDVGLYSAERTWGRGVAERFRRRTGREPAVYYPALWEDIGPETAAARVAFFAARAELLGEGFPALVTAWGTRHGVDVSGHCPGQYEVQPTDMNGDPFTFYRAQPIPMVDVIYRYGFGSEGFKLTSSAADTLDKPIVLAEQFTTRGTTVGYRRTMDSFVRGINWFVTATGHDIGEPSTFAEWAGRISMLLQGGRRVADIAIVYPIASLQAHYAFEAPDNKEGPVGRYAPPSADYLAVGDRLTREMHRDFTFIHPDDLVSPRMRVAEGRLVLTNAENRQEFSTLIVPGTDVISVAVLRRLRQFQEAGGTVIGTTSRPRRSAEFGGDDEVRALVAELYAGACFLPDPTTTALSQALDRLAPEPDVRFLGSPRPTSGGGHLGYLHKVKAGHDIYLVTNSTDDTLHLQVSLRGQLDLERRDPLTGAVHSASPTVCSSVGGPRTQIDLALDPVSCTVLIGRRVRD